MHKKSLLFIGLIALLVGGFVLNDRMGTTVTPSNNAVTTKEVRLNNGDTYVLVADYVTKNIDGRPLRMLAYNGMIPGPTIKVDQGAQVTIHFVNKTDMPTLLHSHGVRVANAFDGTHLVQPDVLPGASFDYVLKFEDPGVFWYHPHVREDKQQNMGLYGNFVVTPSDLAYWPATDHSETIFLSDVLLENGNIAPYSEKYITHALMGRFGNTILINGDTSATLHGEPGEVHRLYVTNAATVRPFNFRIGGGVKMKLVGGDNGRYEKETFVDAVIIAPSERVVLDVLLPAAGEFALEHAVPGGKVYPLGKFVVSGTPVNEASKNFSTLRINEKETALFAGFRQYLGVPAQKKLILTLSMDMGKIMGYMGGGMSGMSMSGMNMGTSTGMGGMMHASVPIEWEDTMGDMNTFSTSDTVKWIMRDEETGKENMDINWVLPRGPYVKIRITNDATSGHPMQHPVHFHGNRFVVLSVNGVPNDNMVWKDTTLLKTGDVVDILLETTNVGKWMAHCHIAEHMHSGMMIGYTVE